ncbi:capsular polysaccharide transport system permease protein [Rhizobium sp. SG_E_25_P2]|uniref:ABC transporter permease n=1 Tax=Rhizobium sp. SG_E_25_P2 TaxID=2879942 RepID=UPI0024751002|nr:ABC transporter permease [Rhizobium sp. SG_E_25_P2]MDH6269119.1 capsular polysaccharide transport system permease protein [Rhizobium sp. SG_E_25_P2]
MSTLNANRREREISVLNGAQNNLRVIVAMIFREAANRFGASPVAYVWTIVEPAILVGILLLARVYFKTVSPAFGESSVMFLLTGVVAFRAVRAVINTGGRAIQANRALFEFGLVKPLDTVVARSIVEFVIWIVILTVFFAAVGRILQTEVITDFQGFVLSMLLVLYFSLSMAMFNATVGALVPVWRSMWKMMSLPLMMTSGVLFVPAQMPPEILAIIIWNPFLHCVEGLRSHSYLDYLTVYSPSYLLCFSTVVLLFSLAMERLFRKEIIRAKGDEDEDEMV